MIVYTWIEREKESKMTGKCLVGDGDCVGGGIIHKEWNFWSCFRPIEFDLPAVFKQR